MNEQDQNSSEQQSNSQPPVQSTNAVAFPSPSSTTESQPVLPQQVNQIIESALTRPLTPTSNIIYANSPTLSVLNGSRVQSATWSTSSVASNSHDTNLQSATASIVQTVPSITNTASYIIAGCNGQPFLCTPITDSSFFSQLSQYGSNSASQTASNSYQPVPCSPLGPMPSPNASPSPQQNTEDVCDEDDDAKAMDTNTPRVDEQDTPTTNTQKDEIVVERTESLSATKAVEGCNVSHSTQRDNTWADRIGAKQTKQPTVYVQCRDNTVSDTSVQATQSPHRYRTRFQERQQKNRLTSAAQDENHNIAHSSPYNKRNAKLSQHTKAAKASSNRSSIAQNTSSNFRAPLRSIDTLPSNVLTLNANHNNAASVSRKRKKRSRSTKDSKRCQNNTQSPLSNRAPPKKRRKKADYDAYKATIPVFPQSKDVQPCTECAFCQNLSILPGANFCTICGGKVNHSRDIAVSEGMFVCFACMFVYVFLSYTHNTCSAKGTEPQQGGDDSLQGVGGQKRTQFVGDKEDSISSTSSRSSGWTTTSSTRRELRSGWIGYVDCEIRDVYDDSASAHSSRDDATNDDEDTDDAEKENLPPTLQHDLPIAQQPATNVRAPNHTRIIQRLEGRDTDSNDSRDVSPMDQNPRRVRFPHEEITPPLSADSVLRSDIIASPNQPEPRNQPAVPPAVSVASTDDERPALSLDAFAFRPSQSNQRIARNTATSSSRRVIQRLSYVPPASNTTNTATTSTESSPMPSLEPSHTPFVFVPPTSDQQHPFAATKPAKVAPTICYTDWQSAIKQTGAFGTDQLNTKQLYYALTAIIIKLVDGQASIKTWKLDLETRRSEGSICAYHQNCRGCNARRSHIACRYADCGILYNQYVSNPCNTTWKPVECTNGNNKALCMHFKAKHNAIYKEAQRYLLYYAESDRPYLNSLLLPIKRYPSGRRKLGIRGVHNAPYNKTESQFAVKVPANDAVKPDEVDAALKFYDSLWSAPDLFLKPRDRHSRRLKSCCPSHTGLNGQCNMEVNGYMPKKQRVMYWDHTAQAAVRKYRCRPHATRKLPAVGKKITIHSQDMLSHGMIRSGNQILDPNGGRMILSTNDDTKGEYEATRSLMTKAFLARFNEEMDRRQETSPFSEKTMLAVFERIVPDIQAFTAIIRNLQIEIFPKANDELDTLVLRTTTTTIAHDQTFNEFQRVGFDDATRLQMGVGTIGTSWGYWLTFYLMNGHSENHEQISKALADVKGRILYHGNLKVLQDVGLRVGFDHYTKFKNIGRFIDHEVSHNLQSNELWLPIADKLNEEGVHAEDIRTIVYECTLHLYMRKYAYARLEGIRPCTHRDFVLIPHSECIWQQSLQHAHGETNCMPPNTPHSDPETYSLANPRYGCYSATDIYWKWSSTLRDDTDTANKWKAVVDSILETDGISNVVQRYHRHRQILQSADYLNAQGIFQDIAKRTHYQHVLQILGYFVTGSSKVDAAWIRNYSDLSDDHGVSHIFMTHACIKLVADVFLKFFRVDITEHTHVAVLRPLHEYISIKYQCLLRILRRKILERRDKDTKPILRYQKILHSVELAASPDSVKGFVANRHEEYTGIWGNVSLERTHQCLRLLSCVRRGVVVAAARLLVLLRKRYLLNVSVIKSIIKDRPLFFDEKFKVEFNAIIDGAYKHYFDRVQQDGLLANITNNWEDHVKQTRVLVNHRDVERTHSSIIKKYDAALFNREICLLRNVETISVDVVGHLWQKFGCSLNVIMRQLIAHSFVSGTMDDGTLVIDPANWPRIRHMIQDGKCKDIQPLAPVPEPGDEKSDLRDLPEVPAYFRQHPQQNNNEQNENHHLALPPLIDTESQSNATSTNTQNSITESQSDESSNRESSTESSSSQSSSSSSSSAGRSEDEAPLHRARGIRPYEDIGTETDVPGVFMHHGQAQLSSSLQIEAFNCLWRAIQFVNKEVPNVYIADSHLDEVSFGCRSKISLLKSFRDSWELINLFTANLPTGAAKKMELYFKKKKNWQQLLRYTGVAESDRDPLALYYEKHSTQPRRVPIGGNKMGGDSIVNPAANKRRRTHVELSKDSIYKQTKGSTKSKWKRKSKQLAKYESFHQFRMPFNQWAPGCECSFVELDEIIEDSNDEPYGEWQSASDFRLCLDELSMYSLDAMSQRRQRAIATWHGWQKYAHAATIGSAIDYLLLHFMGGKDKNDQNKMTEDEVEQEIHRIFNKKNKSLWINRPKKKQNKQ